MLIKDPDEFALDIVLQYLKEQGYESALQELEKESGMKFNDQRLETGSQLMQLIWQESERQLSLTESDDAARETFEEEELLRGGNEDFATAQVACLEGQHPSNIIAIDSWELKSTIVTGGGDGCVRMLDWNGDLHWEKKLQCGPILSLQLHPQIEQGYEGLLVGTMDGALHLLDANNGNVLHSERPHEKWVVRIVFLNGIIAQDEVSAKTSYIVTASRHNKGGQITLSMVTRNEDGNLTFQVLQSLPFSQTVQDIALLKEVSEVVVAIRDSNYLMRFEFKGSKLVELPKVNMNIFQDDHVSFFAMTLDPSPCGQFMLVSTNVARLLVYRVKSWKQIRNIYGLPIEQYFQPVTTWHPDSNYVYVAAAGGAVFVYHVGTAKQVGVLRGHEKNARAMFYSEKKKCLVTAGYDKTVRKFVQ